MPAKKAKPRTSQAATSAKAKDPDPSASTKRPTAPPDPPVAQRGGPTAPARQTFGIVVASLAGLALVAGIATLSLAIHAYENVNMAGTFTVDQQVQMATGGVIAGTGLAVAGLITLGLAFIGFRRA